MPDKHGRAIPDDTVYKPITDHPDFPSEVHQGDGYYSPDRAVVQRWVDAWNSLGSAAEWPWRVGTFVLLPPRKDVKSKNTAQMTLW